MTSAQNGFFQLPGDTAQKPPEEPTHGDDDFLEMDDDELDVGGDTLEVSDDSVEVGDDWIEVD
jgi:hypothetical protein